MVSSDALSRLSAMNREPLASASNDDGEEPKPCKTSPPPRFSTDAEPESGDPADLPAGVEVCNEHGTYWRIEARLEHVWPEAPDFIAQVESRLSRRAVGRGRLERELEKFGEVFPHDVLLLDLETCGFVGAPIFLAGVLHHDNNELRLSQLLARTFEEEKAMLAALHDMAGAKQMLITYNGRCFDWPSVCERLRWHQLNLGDNARRPHFDVLHHAKRHWRGAAPNCRLQTLEAHICGRTREGDIPGRKIPRAYREFTRSGDATQIRRVLHHNAIDLATTLELALRIAQAT